MGAKRRDLGSAPVSGALRGVPAAKLRGFDEHQSLNV